MKCDGDCLNCKFDDCIGEPKKDSRAEYQRQYRKEHKEKFKIYERRKYIKKHADEMCRRRLKPILEMKVEADDGKSIQTENCGGDAEHKAKDFETVDL